MASSSWDHPNEKIYFIATIFFLLLMSLRCPSYVLKGKVLALVNGQKFYENKILLSFWLVLCAFGEYFWCHLDMFQAIDVGNLSF